MLASLESEIGRALPELFRVCLFRNLREYTETEIAPVRMATNQTQSAWPLRKPQQLVYVELGPYNGGMMLGICELGFSFRAVAPLKADGPINFAFALDGRTRLQGSGEIAWTEDDGKTGGLKFSSVSPQFRESLRAWLVDDALPKNAGREHTPAIALPLDSIDKIKSRIREGKTDAIKASLPRVEQDLAEEESPNASTAPVRPSFQKPIVPSEPELSPLAPGGPETTEPPTVSPASDSTFVLAKFHIPSVSDPLPPPHDLAAPPLAPLPSQPAVTPHTLPLPPKISPIEQTTLATMPPSTFSPAYLRDDSVDESPRLNRAAAFAIISLALAVILGALVLSFRREVGETLIHLGTQLAGEQKPPSPATQTPPNPIASSAHSDAAPAPSAASNSSPAVSDQTPASTGSSQPSAPPAQLPDVPAQSPPPQTSTIQQVEDLPTPEDGGSGQKEFDQAKTILKGNHRQRDIQMAVALLWTGVRKGYVPAEVTLADLYARGDGVGRSCEQARVLLKVAVQKGSPEGRRRLDQLKRQGCPAR